MRLRIIRGLWYITLQDGSVIGGGYKDMGDCLVWLSRTHKNFSVDWMGNVCQA